MASHALRQSQRTISAHQHRAHDSDTDDLDGQLQLSNSGENSSNGACGTERHYEHFGPWKLTLLDLRVELTGGIDVSGAPGDARAARTHEKVTWLPCAQIG